MKFQILKLIIWPKISNFNPQVVVFKPGMVNIITGGSRTGKSAIIPIIDYCLASSDCSIPIDTIRDHAAWYGIVIETFGEKILISRRVPVGNKVSNEYFVSRADNSDIPRELQKPNETTDGVKNILNSISGVPYFRLESPDDDRPYRERLGFRDLMALVFQSQDIVANQNIIFYKTHAHEHRERLRNWFPYILGAENVETLAARQRLSVIQKRLAHLRKEAERTKTVSESWLANMKGNIQIAREYGLVANIPESDLSQFQMLEIARRLVSDPPDHSNSEVKDLQVASETMIILEREDDVLGAEIGVLKKRLDDVKRLRESLVDYGNNVRKRSDRLQISEWLSTLTVQSPDCMLCGNPEHTKSTNEISKIAQAFSKVEDEANRTREVPTSFAREEESIKSQLQSIILTRRALNERLSGAKRIDRMAHEEFQRRKNLFLFLGRFRAFLETYEAIIAGEKDGGELAILLEEEKMLLARVDPYNVQGKMKIALSKISQKVLSRLQTLDVENKYREVAPEFSVKDLNLLVPSNDGHWHFLAEVGSASNWVSFHIALMCALQEFFVSLPHSCVPSFVIFDQPSQVYFPKLKRSAGIDDDQKYEDEDVDAVRGMFKTLVNSIKETRGAWQSIVLDHASDEIYGGIDGVFEVAVWRDGKKLIPMEWYT